MANTFVVVKSSFCCIYLISMYSVTTNKLTTPSIHYYKHKCLSSNILRKIVSEFNVSILYFDLKIHFVYYRVTLIFQISR